MLPAVNLGVRFLMELGALAALGLWGFQWGQGPLAKALLGLGSPLLAAALWGTFVAPKSLRRLPDPVRLVPELLVFGAGATALAVALHPLAGGAFGVVAAVSVALTFLWKQR